MEASDVQEQLSDCSLQNTVVKCRIVAPDARQGHLAYRVSMLDDAAVEVSKIAEISRKILCDSNLVEYGPTALIPKSHVMCLPQESAATLTVINAAVTSDDLDEFHPSSTISGEARTFAARFLHDSLGEITFYRLAETLLEFKQRRVLGFVRDGGAFAVAEPGRILLMKPVFDVVVAGGWAFFWKKPLFERSFGFLEELKRDSAQSFSEISEHIEVEGLEEFRKACTTQPQMMAKIASIKQSMKDPEYAAAMKMPNLLKYIDEHPEVKIKLDGQGADRRFVFDPADLANRFQILKLLDDDFLHSMLTQRDYESIAKAGISSS